MKNNTINNMTKLASKMPKTLNEALNFNDNLAYEDENNVVDVEQENEIPVDNGLEMQPAVNPASQKAKKLIDDIRKMSLRAMAELADTPEDENYIMLKKVWSMTDRKPEQEKNNNS